MTDAIEPIRPQIVNTRPWQATFTMKEAVSRGLVTKQEYQFITLWARTVAEHHGTRDTSRCGWEPNATHTEQLVGRDIDAGDAKLETRLSLEFDSPLDQAHAATGQTRSITEAAEGHPHAVTTPESGITYTGAEAAGLIEQHDERIRVDYEHGKTHHKRSNPLLVKSGRWAPWGEGLGCFAYVTDGLNVPLLRPWEDVLGWSFAIIVVVGVLLGQTWVIRHAAESHNQAREASADNNRHEAEAGYAKRNRYLVAASGTAIAITSGMVLRGLAALGNAAVLTTVVMLLLAVVTGIVLPTLAYLAIALDGSRRSRERDGLAKHLGDSVHQQSNLIAAARANIEFTLGVDAVLRQKIVPDICADVETTINAAHPVYNFGRIQIGGLEADPPEKVGMTITKDDDGNVAKALISTGIPGARSVDLRPLLNRTARLAELVKEAEGLRARLDAIPAHPWAKSSHVSPQ